MTIVMTGALSWAWGTSDVPPPPSYGQPPVAWKAAPRLPDFQSDVRLPDFRAESRLPDFVSQPHNVYP